MKCKLRLYVADNKLTSLKAKNQIKKMLKEIEDLSYELEVIDIQKNPSIAEKDNISAIPTLIKVSSSSIKRAIGDLSDTEKFMEWLGTCYELQDLESKII